MYYSNPLFTISKIKLLYLPLTFVYVWVKKKELLFALKPNVYYFENVVIFLHQLTGIASLHIIRTNEMQKLLSKNICTIEIHVVTKATLLAIFRK